MRRVTLMLSAAALVFAAADVSAQAKPSFAGKWAQVVDPNAAPPTGRGRGGMMGLGTAATITQDEKTLTLVRTTQAGEMKSVYNLDGSDSKNTLAMGANSIETVSKAKWEGSKLVVSTSIDFNGTPITTTMALELDASGNLVVESSGMGRGGAAATPVKSTYKKA
jgi:hypothetical protein